MTAHTIYVSAGWIAVVLGIIGTIAQYVRINRLGVEGVSLATWALFVCMGCFWVTFGAVSAHSWQVVLGSLLLLPVQVSIVAKLRPYRRWRVTTRSLVFFVLCCVLPTLVWGWVGGVYGTGFAMVATRVPQIIELIRYEDASGVSVSSWALGVFGTALWVSYYVGVHLWAPLISTFCAGVASLVIALLASWRHQQARNRLIALEVFAD